VIGRAAYDLLRLGLRFAVQLWPLWLFWFAWSLSNHWWLDYLLSFPDRSTQGCELALYAWPTVALLGDPPLAARRRGLPPAACQPHRAGRRHRRCCRCDRFAAGPNRNR
jgi:hypothetical protein